MKLKFTLSTRFIIAGGWLCAVSALANPILTSWFTMYSTEYARVIQTATNTTGTQNVNPVTTWPTSGVPNNNSTNNTTTNLPASQYLPAYSDVQKIRYDANNVYINSSGFASYTMGPFLNGKGGLFGFWPLSQNYTVSFPLKPGTVPTSKTTHQGGLIGLMVNGVGIYDLGDAFGFVQTANSPAVTGSDAMGSTGTTHPWWRDALAVEVVTFDPGFAHQPGLNGQYHYHAEPKALRYQLGDNMQATYNPTNNNYLYTEDTSNLHHSPILGWSFDGYPIYGPYGYSNPTNPASPVTRMRSGFILRNSANAATYGVTDLTTNTLGRTTLPKWAAIAEGFTYVAGVNNDYNLTSSLYGPATSYTSTGPSAATYSLGRYIGDYDYLGDRTNALTGTNYQPGIDFDLDQYNGRTCVTPDFTNGTYAYFVAIDAAGNPVFPYLLGKQYFGTKSGSAQGVTVPTSGITNYFLGGTNLQEVLKAPSVNSANGTITLTWSSVEGGSYVLLTKTNLNSANWTTNAILLAATNAILTTVIDSGAAPTNTARFYRTVRTTVASFAQ